jgi:hypothetical protein
MSLVFAAPRTHINEEVAIKSARSSGSANVTPVHAGRLPIPVEAGYFDARSETSAKSEVNIGCPSFWRL